MFSKHTPGRHAAARVARRRARLSMLGPVATAAVVTAVFAGGAYVVTNATTPTQLELAPPASPTSTTLASQAAPSASPSAKPSPSTSTSPRVQDPASRGGTRSAAPSPTPTRKSSVVSTGTCEASFYWEPQPTASGETFDPEAMTAAHKNWAFGTRVRVTNLANNKSVTVRINDRGPYIDGRCLDLARGAFREISSLDAGVTDVRYEVLAN